MNVLFTREGHLIRAHLDHTLKSFYYCTEVPIAYLSEQKHVLATYPASAASLFTDELKTALAPLPNSDGALYTHTVAQHYLFLLAPIFCQGVLKGTLVAGPIVTQPDHHRVTTVLEQTDLSKHAVYKKPPRHFYLGQLMHHLISKSIYIKGVKRSDQAPQYITFEDMRMRQSTPHTGAVLAFIVKMVVTHQKQKALDLYEKSLLFDDFLCEVEGCPFKGDGLMALKQSLTALQSLISHELLKNACDADKVVALQSKFFLKLWHAEHYDDLVAIGESIISVYSDLANQQLLDGKSQPVRKTIQYVKTHFSAPIHLEDICQNVGLSKAYLSTLFSEETGATLTEFIRSTRIEYSQQLLAHTDASILEVAHESGFETQNYFSTVFKNQTGMTPNGYRKSVRQ